MKITELESKESGSHYYSKEYLLSWIIEKQVAFKDNSYYFTIDIDYLNFCSTEAYLYKNWNNTEPFTSGVCLSCFDDKKFKNIDTNIENRFKNNINDFNKNVLIYDEETQYYKTHPCNLCSFKGKLDCVFIFDIAFGNKGVYKLAIEVVNTSPTKNNKIMFCKENEINLIQVQASDILKTSQKKNKVLKCEILNSSSINRCFK